MSDDAIDDGCPTSAEAGVSNAAQSTHSACYHSWTLTLTAPFKAQTLEITQICGQTSRINERPIAAIYKKRSAFGVTNGLYH